MIVGIDPGKSGACAILENGQFRAVIDLPYDGKELIVGELTEWIGAHGKPDKVIYEKQWPRPLDGGSRAWYAGYNYCLLEWQLWACYGIKTISVAPQTWKRAAHLEGEGKQSSILKARGLFPAAAEWLKRKKDDGRAEAMLIAYYGAR